MTKGQEEGRYSRQILFRPIGREGQDCLADSRVALVGAGALGTVIAAQLARAGVGYLRIIDRDIIEFSNLQRQSLYDESDAECGMPKAVAAREKLLKANSSVRIDAEIADVTWRNAESLLSDVDVIVDGTDNFQIRYIINDVAVKHDIPWAYGGAVSSYGTTAFFRPGQTACLVCLYGSHQGGGHDTCDTIGVISPVIHLIASLQVTETLKYLTGNHSALTGGVTYADVWNNEFRTIQFPERKENCPCCGQRQFSALTTSPDAVSVSFCGRHTIQVKPGQPLTIPLRVLADRLRKVGTVQQNDYLLRCSLLNLQITVFADGRALIQGTDDASVARSTYAKYIGM